MFFAINQPNRILIMNSEKRDEQNGSMAFHKGTEDDLAKFVLTNAEKNNPESVIKAIDTFCWNNHWMMHVGDKKGTIVDNIILEHKPKYLLELGTYCSYSAIRMARLLPQDGLVLTIDPFPQPAAKTIVEFSGLTHKIQFLHGYGADVIPTLKTKYNAQIDMVFIDHDKKAYLSDLKLLEQNNLMRRGCAVVADNVLIFHIDDYLNHVRNSGLYKSSINHVATLEYDDSGLNERVDGIEVSIW